MLYSFIFKHTPAKQCWPPVGIPMIWNHMEGKSGTLPGTEWEMPHEIFFMRGLGSWSITNEVSCFGILFE